MRENLWLNLITMAAVTYLIRMIPLAFMRKKIENKWISSFLFYVPYAVLGAMTFPDVLYSTGNLWTALCGLIVAVVMAWRGRSLLTVAICACVAVAAAQGFMLLF